jgi:uncharacterized membrane protein YhaH (DUF805 family)
MDFQNLFLNFQGRITRSQWWVGSVIMNIAQWLVFSFAGGGGLSGAAMRGNPIAIAHSFRGHGLIGAILLAGLLWPALAVQVKRWHDRDKSGWMTLINLIPIIGFFWTLIECGFLEGTPGPNKYGPSPKQLQIV